MSVMRTVAVRNLAAHKVRLALTLASVLLGTAFVAGSFIFTDTLKHSFDTIFATSDKGVGTQVATRHDSDPGVPTSLLRTLAKTPGVRTVQPNISASVVLVDPHGKRLQSGGAPSIGGAWLTASESVNPLPDIISGDAPHGSDQVVINDSAASKNHLATGDRITVVLPNAKALHVRISGIYRVSFDTGGYIGALFSQPEAMALFTDGTHVSSVDLSAQPGVSEQTLTARIAALLPSDLKAKTGTQVRADDSDDVQTALSFVNYILLGFGLIALIVGTFIIYNTFSMIVAQRQRELALLRAIGADRRQIRRSITLEAAAIGVLGSALGLAGGIGLAYALHAVLDGLDLGLPSGGLVLAPRTVIVTLLLGSLVTLLAASSPARRAAKIPPVEAMRAEFATPTAGSLRRRTALGAVAATAAAAATLGGVLDSSAGSGSALVGLGLFAAAAAAMLLSPVLARLIIGPLGRIVGRPFGPLGQLARTNALRNPRRTAATAFALTLGLILVAGIAVVGSSAKASIGQVVDTTVRADYLLTTQSDVGVPLPAVAAATHVPGVASMTELHDFSAIVDGTPRDGTAIDGPVEAVMNLHLERGRAGVGAHDLLVSQQRADAGWTLGSSHRFTAPGKAPVQLTVTGIYQNSQLLGPWMASGVVYRELVPTVEWSDEVGLVKASTGTDLATLRTGLERAVNSYYVVDVQNRTEFAGQVAGQINGLIGLLYGLLGLAIVIAILGIINTLALSVVERRREIGMLRAIGMQRVQLRRTLYLESLLIAVFGASLGLTLGLGYGALLTRALRAQGLDRLSVPWSQAAAFLVLSAVVGVLAALWPGIRAARTSPLAAISTG